MLAAAAANLLRLGSYGRVEWEIELGEFELRLREKYVFAHHERDEQDDERVDRNRASDGRGAHPGLHPVRNGDGCGFKDERRKLGREKDVTDTGEERGEDALFFQLRANVWNLIGRG